ncbi:hypothetical protein [Chromobacterium violaceum]|uniref:hypothetical protein n=1 Tax=Chromobacterium violaceum TaxID=536 RepID=UPI00111C8844|nr:hypothetical protein [Chromobacterium violaceum]
MKSGRHDEDGITYWYQNGELHRDDGPAVECDEFREWWSHGVLHREDGPAIDWPSGPGGGWSKRWFLNGVELSEEQFNQWLEKKRLNEKLQSALAPSPGIKKGKI